ncbi:MAG: DUF2779 domain-containing protein [Gemmatimonadales bacterium]|jgi:hypothetical protein
MAHALSKSRFVAGWQCHKLLWWRVHEPDAPELEPDVVLQDRFDQGVQVGALARDWFPGGVLIDLPHDAGADRVAATRAAIDAGAPAIFEATFIEDGVFVAVDVLERDGDGWVVIEVKSSTKVKDEHVPDAAVQCHVVRRAGLRVNRVEIMHLDPDFRHPDQGELFARSDVSAQVERMLPEVPGLVAQQLAMLDGELPRVAVGVHCWKPRDCPFFDRCWPDERDHVRHLYYARKADTVERMRTGVQSLHDLPPDTRLNATQQRQMKAIGANALIVERGLATALEPLRAERVGHLDFETIQRAVPVWHGQKPWEQTAVQFSYHEVGPDGTTTHDEYLAEGPDDPRDEIAERLIAATAGADRIVHFSHFEKTRIEALVKQLPHRADELHAIVERLVDLLPIIRNHVYHPEFRGSFSLKAILTPLVPDLTYDDLVIMDGMRASVEIARLLFFQHLVQNRDKTRRDLLEYCERDTWATVKLAESLEQVASAGRER